MKKIITITGAKQTGKMELASKLSGNSDCVWVKPYTNSPNAYPDCYNVVNKETLSAMIDEEKPIFTTLIKGYRYVVFPSQLLAEYNVLIVDDYALIDVKDAWKNIIVTIKVHSEKEQKSERSGVYLYDHEFDIVFNTDTGNVYELEAEIEWLTRKD